MPSVMTHNQSVRSLTHIAQPEKRIAQIKFCLECRNVLEFKVNGGARLRCDTCRPIVRARQVKVNQKRVRLKKQAINKPETVIERWHRLIDESGLGRL